MSGEEGFEEWDADFLDQLIQVEELALSSTAAPCYASSSQYPHTHSPPHLEFSHSRYENTDTITHSPPPHLSQRLITDAQHGDARDLQVNRLKFYGWSVQSPRYWRKVKNEVEILYLLNFIVSNYQSELS
uniref:Uncharacterized protein n=1 Tax=Vitis vinifera TaxID=29760 RepID=A5BZ33_VITVI|nr:hypothetical protein VITISV_037887 [Vitis vinifera]